MIPLPDSCPTASPVPSNPEHEMRMQYERLDPVAQRYVLLALARDHSALLGTRAMLELLCSLADIVTPIGNAPFGDPPRGHAPPRVSAAGPVYLDLKLGDPEAEKPFTLSVLRNPPRFRTGSPLQPQLLITSFPVDFAGALGSYHRFGGAIAMFLEHRGCVPAPANSPAVTGGRT